MRRTGSPRIVGYGTLAAAGLVGALALRRPELAAAAAPFALVLAVGLRVARAPELSVSLSLPDERTHEGADVDVSLEVTADRPVDRLELLVDLPRAIAVVGGASTHAVRLGAQEPRDLPLTIRCTRWGVFRFGRIDVRARDPLRLVTWETSFDRPQRLKAYPTQITVRQLLSPVRTQALAGSEVARTKGDGVEYADLRDFVAGDRVRAINWRASARRQGLVVNERHPERNTDVVLFLDSFTDVRRGGESILDEAVRATASLATRYLERRDRVGLIGFGGVLRWLQPGLGITQRYRLIETMIETGVEPTYTWRDVNLIPARILPPGSLVLGLTPLLDARFVAALEDLRARRFDVAVVEVDPVPLVEPGSTAAEKLAYRVWLLEREVIRARLVALGVGVATWGDGELDAVLEEVRTYRRYARLARA
ncbi:MAG TPA: DUF58 domain-containing protein [Gaiellaceae bacterium]|nr:DUF58 domain-containing protein [Gaiellaceae bacterium]